MTQPNYDLKTAMARGMSIRPGTTISGGSGANGLSVDMKDTVGPVQAIGGIGNLTGTPTSFTHTLEIEESTDESTWTDCSPRQNATATGTVNPVDQVIIATAVRSKRYCRAVFTDNFTGGTSPTHEVCAFLFAQKIHA